MSTDDKRFPTIRLNNHTLEIDRETGSLRISGSGWQTFAPREEARQTLLFLLDNADAFQDPQEERDLLFAAQEERRTEEWLENGRRTDNQVAYDQIHEEAARIAKLASHMMKEPEAHELLTIINKDAPWLTAAVHPAHWYDDYIAPEMEWYVVHVETDSFSAEFYHINEWVKLVEQLTQAGTNEGPKAISREALDAWATTAQSHARLVGSIPAELRERINEAVQRDGEQPNFRRYVLDSPALPNPGSYSYMELQPHGARNYLLDLGLPPWHSGVLNEAAARAISNLTGVTVPVADHPIAMNVNDQALVVTVGKQIGLLVRVE